MPHNGAKKGSGSHHESEFVNESSAIKACLSYLADEAFKLELRFTGHLISVAAESIEEEKIKKVGRG